MLFIFLTKSVGDSIFVKITVSILAADKRNVSFLENSFSDNGSILIIHTGSGTKKYSVFQNILNIGEFEQQGLNHKIHLIL
jgi:hypothetical protein